MTERSNSTISGASSLDSVNLQLPNGHVVREGWLQKRGEFIKNWRPRYFFLLDNGMLLGFREKRTTNLSDPLNNFSVKGCQILPTERPKPHTFIIRIFNWTTPIERIFHTQTNKERQEWMDDILSVKDKLAETSSGEDLEIASETQAMEDLHMRYPDSDEQDVPTTSGGRIKKKKITLDNFEFLKVLGKGTFGKVILCRERGGRQKLYAIKALRKDVVISRDEVAHTLTENQVLQKVDHPFLIHLKYSFTTASHLFFVLEYANGGELFFHLRKEKTFPESRARFYAGEICLALRYLHERDIIYRDLKLENLLLDSDGHIKVADFGLCKEEISYGKLTRTFCGTPEYLAPEVLEENYYGRSVDWWGFGVCLYEMIVGCLPFYNRDHDTLYQMIVNDDVRFPRTLSDEARDILRGLLLKDPHRRLGGGPNDSKEVMGHSFFLSINWTLLEEKKIPPPFLPEVQNDTDTHYFDFEFTSKPVQLTPPDKDEQLNVITEECEYFPDFIEFSYQDTSSTIGSSLESSRNSFDVTSHS